MKRSRVAGFCAVVVLAVIASCSTGHKKITIDDSPAMISPPAEVAATPPPPSPQVPAPSHTVSPLPAIDLAPGVPPPPDIAPGLSYSVTAPASNEAYARIEESGFLTPQLHPLSTFAIDVDTGAYSNVRRFLQDGMLPPPDAVRIEELINYFPYSYAPPSDSAPVTAHVSVARCPWNEELRLVRIGLKAQEIAEEERPRANLVFLIDVSGSMADQNKLPLVKRALSALVPRLRDDDRVAIVTYAGYAGVALESTRCSVKGRESILRVIDALGAGGSTAGSEGIRTAYRIAEQNLVNKGINRVILASDGDFNVGITDRGELLEYIANKTESGVFLTVLGFGMGNLKDATLEQLADKGNGNYGYIDTFSEARKMLVEQTGSTLVTVAKDVKVQVEWNPAKVMAYRLVGYENRMLTAEEFNDDKKDAGEMGAGHCVTALYEVAPHGAKLDLPDVDPLKYQPAGETGVHNNELLTLKVRYKAPREDDSRLLTWAVPDDPREVQGVDSDFVWAAAVAEFGLLLRSSAHAESLSYDDVLALAQASRGADESGYRAEFVRLVHDAKALDEKGRQK